MTAYYISSSSNLITGQSFGLVPQPCTNIVRPKIKQLNNQPQKGFTKQTVVTNKIPTKYLPVCTLTIRLKFKKLNIDDGLYIGSDTINQEKLRRIQQCKSRTRERNLTRAIKEGNAYVY